LTPSFEKKPRTQGHESLSQKTRGLMAAHGKDFVILACTVLTQYSSVTDGRTNGQTDRRTPMPWLRREKHSAIARKNYLIVSHFERSTVTRIMQVWINYTKYDKKYPLSFFVAIFLAVAKNFKAKFYTFNAVSYSRKNAKGHLNIFN